LAVWQTIRQGVLAGVVAAQPRPIRRAGLSRHVPPWRPMPPRYAAPLLGDDARPRRGEAEADEPSSPPPGAPPARRASPASAAAARAMTERQEQNQHRGVGADPDHGQGLGLCDVRPRRFGRTASRSNH